MSIKNRLLDYFVKHPKVVISRNTLTDVALTHEWTRSIRTLREEGWQIESGKDGYILISDVQIQTNKKRRPIDSKLRYSIIHRDNSTCQRCGKTVEDKIKLEVDHKLPVDWGGTNDRDNLWTLCNKCNGGKKHFFSDYDQAQMKSVMALPSGALRIKMFFELNPNIEIPPYRFEVISKIRDWTRTIRGIRQKYQMNIVWRKATAENPEGTYIYYP